MSRASTRVSALVSERAHAWVVTVAAVAGILGVWLLASAFLFVGWMVHDGRRYARSHAIGYTLSDARSVRLAVEMYLQAYPGAGCPNASQLVSERFLSARERTEDSWGNSFTIECRGGGVVVTSAGPDGTFRTSDDVR